MEKQLNNYNKKSWKSKYFLILIGQGVSFISSGILTMAIILYLTEKTGSAMVLSVASLAGFLPQAVLGPVIGVLVDRWSRKAVMIGADLFIAAASAVLAFIALYMELPIWMIMLILFIRSVGTAFHTPALAAVTPLLVPEEELTKCSGYSQAITSVGSIISPAGGAFFYAIWPLNGIIMLDVAGAIVASIAVMFVAIPKLAPKAQEIKPDFIKEMKDGYLVLKAEKGLLPLLWIGTVYMFIFIPIGALFPLMSMEYFGGNTSHASIAEISFAVGMLCGGILLGIWGGFKKKTHTISLSVLIMGVSLMIAGLLPVTGFPVYVVCCAIMGLSSPLYGVQGVIFQEKISPEYLGRVFSLSGSMMSLAMPLGLLLSGAFAEQLGVHIWFLVSGVAVLITACVCFILPSINALNSKN